MKNKKLQLNAQTLFTYAKPRNAASGPETNPTTTVLTITVSGMFHAKR